MTKRKILLLTLVHPDFLPPVYATAQVLRDIGFDIHIITFDSFVPASFDVGNNIDIETLGRHYDAGFTERLQLRKKFISRASELVRESPVAIIAFCPFSFQAGLDIKKKTPLLYIALEVADFSMGTVLNSPLTSYRNLMAIRNMHKADLVATPSVQRSAWLAGRCHLQIMPYTILNTVYLKPEEDNYDTFKEILQPHFLDKKIVLYTGAVNSDQCVQELVRAFDMVNDPDSALVITGIRDDEYSADIQKFVAGCKSRERIQLFPYLTRQQMLSLQSNAHIGACLIREAQDNVKSKMMAPNKIGEYMSKSLYVLGIATEYLKPFKIRGFASLAESATPRDISKALREALAAVTDTTYKQKIKSFVKEDFCMQQQLKPVIKFITERIGIN